MYTMVLGADVLPAMGTWAVIDPKIVMIAMMIHFPMAVIYGLFGAWLVHRFDLTVTVMVGAGRNGPRILDRPVSVNPLPRHAAMGIHSGRLAARKSVITSSRISSVPKGHVSEIWDIVTSGLLTASC